MRSRHWWSIVVVVLAVVCIGSAFRFVTGAPNTIAASSPFSGEALHGGGGISFCPAHRTDPHCVQDENFIALKRAGRIGWPGCVAPKKGTQIDPIVLPAPCAKPAAAPAGKVGGWSAAQSMNWTARWGNCNDCYELDEGPIWNVFEPSAGGQGDFNFGYNTKATDDDCLGLGCTGSSYFDQYFWDLCGPGAADVTLWYWPKPPNGEETLTQEPISQVWTLWKGNDPYDGTMRMRGYMMDLAYVIHPPAWPQNGMQQGSFATIDWAMRQGLNWEASGHQNTIGFYASDYPDSSGNARLRSDVTKDVSGYFGMNVPVVVLLDARYLPNWSVSHQVGHYVTIIGYNNDNSQYAYVDTCGYWTYCNHGPNTDGQVHVVDQQTLFNGILSYGNEWIW